MSDISSISSYYDTWLKTQNRSSQKAASNNSSASSSLVSLLTDENNQNNQNSIDGDTFQLSSADNSNVSYNFNGNSYDGSYNPIGSFLNKVKNGTVTTDDIDSMQNMLNQSPLQPSSSDSNSIGSFLNKVKDGTVTTDDLTNMETLLNQTSDSTTSSTSGSTDSLTSEGISTDQPPAPPAPPLNSDSSSSSSTDSSDTSDSTDLIKTFLDKVKSGTVTTDDLTNMETLLNQIF